MGEVITPALLVVAVGSLPYAFGGEVGIVLAEGVLVPLIDPGSEGFNLPVAFLLSSDPSLF